MENKHFLTTFLRKTISKTQGLYEKIPYTNKYLENTISNHTLPLLEKVTETLDKQIAQTINAIQPLNQKISQTIEGVQDNVNKTKDDLKENVRGKICSISKKVLDTSTHIYENQRVVRNLVDFSFNAQKKITQLVDEGQTKLSTTRTSLYQNLNSKKTILNNQILKLTELVIAQQQVRTLTARLNDLQVKGLKQHTQLKHKIRSNYLKVQEKKRFTIKQVEKTTKNIVAAVHERVSKYLKQTQVNNLENNQMIEEHQEQQEKNEAQLQEELKEYNQDNVIFLDEQPEGVHEEIINEEQRNQFSEEIQQIEENEYTKPIEEEQETSEPKQVKKNKKKNRQASN